MYNDIDIFDCIDEMEAEEQSFVTFERDKREYSAYCRERSRVRDWTYRIGYELKQHKDFCAVTLTYDDEHLPHNGELSVRDVQLFLKKLRKHIYPSLLRFFGCGEYGKKGHRPHYHEILFGYCPNDLVYSHTDDSGIKFYRSQSLAKIWNNGFVIVCKDVSPSTIPYLCKYLQKSNDFSGKDKKPFLHMSRKPGIGFHALSDPLLDINSDKMYYRGKYCRIPRYYLKLLTYTDSDDFKLFGKRREDIDNELAIRGENIVPQVLLERRRDFYYSLQFPSHYIDEQIECYYRGMKKFKEMFKK